MRYHVAALVFIYRVYSLNVNALSCNEYIALMCTLSWPLIKLSTSNQPLSAVVGLA